MSYTTYLAHHGIKGQKWGVRRYQNEDGSLTYAGHKRLRKISKKYDRKAKIVSKIVSTLSDDEYLLLNPGVSKNRLRTLGRDYYDKSAGETYGSVAKRIIIRDKKLHPVSYLDAHVVNYDGEKPGLNISIATANNNGSRGKGYADKAVKKMLKWHAKNKKIFGDIEWDVAPNNVASRRLAEKNGFEYNYTGSNGWVQYIHHSVLSKEVSHSVIVNDDIYYYRSYLAHHGIKGQKWGVRRFQKADGSLTAAGAKRYGIKSAMSAGRKVGSGLVKAARGGIQKVKEVKARKAAEKLERQKKVWAKTRLGLTMNADKFTIEELREANDRLDQRDRAAKGFADQIQRGVGYFQAIRDVTGAIKDTKNYIEDISGETERKKKAADELKYQRDLKKEQRTFERDLEKARISDERSYEYKREKDMLDRESKERIEKMKLKKKDKGDKKKDEQESDKPEGNTIELNGKKYDADFMKQTNPEAYEYAMKKQKDDARKARLDYLEERTKAYKEKKDAGSGQDEPESKKDSKQAGTNQNEGGNYKNQYRTDKYRAFANNVDNSDFTDDQKNQYKKMFYNMVKNVKGDDEDFDLATERSFKAAIQARKTSDNRKSEEARRKAEAEANREETAEERQKRKVAEGKAYGAEAQYQANMSQLNSMSDSQLAKMAFRRKTSEVVDTVKSLNPKSMAEKYLASGERKRQEQEARRIAEMSVENLERNYKAMANRFGQDAADRSLTEYTDKARRSVQGLESNHKFVGKTYKPDERRMAKDRQELQNYRSQEQIDSNVKKLDKLRREAKRALTPRAQDAYAREIKELEDENRKLRESIKHSDISAYGAYLAHHGIKGQKWGIRRFQNEDGTLTKAGLRRQAKAEKFRSKELERYNKNIDRATERGQKSTKQVYERLAKHLVQMTVDDIYKERRAVRTQAIGKAVLAGTATALASSFVGLPNIASIPMGVAMGKAASAGTRDQYRLKQIAHAVIFADDNALEHHGIKGQKWGVRRFQDEAGRLTAAGKKRAAELRDKVTSKLKINAKSIDFEAQGGGGGGTIDGWEDVSKEDEITLNDQKASLVLFLDRGMMSEEEVKELADAFGYELDDSLPMDVHLRRLSETITKTKGSDLKTAMFNFQQTQRKKVSYSDGIANGVSAVVNALFSSNLAAVADPVLFVKDVISAEVAKAKAEKRKQSEPVDEETGLHLKQNTDASREEDLKDVNPGWKNLATNTKHNCMCCTATYDMRRRGYDVTANEVQFGYDYGDVTRWYPDAKVERLDTTKLERKYVHKSSEEIQTQYKQEVNEQLQKELVAQGDGARGNLMVSWDGGGGHSMAYEVVDGVAYIYDGQANMKLDTMNVVSVAHDIQYARLDNVDFDPEKIKEVVH